MREVLAGDFVIHESASRREAIDLVRHVGNVDVAVVDVHCEAASEAPSGNEAIRALRRAAPALGIVAHGGLPERHVATAALQAGATAYVARTAEAEEMARAVRSALEDEHFVDPAVPPKGSRGKLTRRQSQILQLLADGKSSAVAARELGVSEETMKTHTRNALARLGARNRAHGVAIALRESLID